MSAEAWSCLGCGQRNSGWSHECGRCGVIKQQASIYDLAAQLKSIKPPHLPGLHLDKPLDEALEAIYRDAGRMAAERAGIEMVPKREEHAWGHDSLVKRGWSTPEQTASMQREIDRLRLALACEIADRMDGALSPNSYQPPPVPPDRL